MQREHCVDDLHWNGTKKHRKTFSVCCLTVQMRRKYPKGSSFNHSFIIRHFLCVVVNFTFSTHISGRFLFIFECISDDGSTSTHIHKRTNTQIHTHTAYCNCNRNQNLTSENLLTGEEKSRQLIRSYNKSDGKNAFC